MYSHWTNIGLTIKVFVDYAVATLPSKIVLYLYSLFLFPCFPIPVSLYLCVGSVVGRNLVALKRLPTLRILIGYFRGKLFQLTARHSSGYSYSSVACNMLIVDPMHI